QPVAITANTVYIVSYHTNTGHFSFDVGTFGSGSVDSGVLHALAASTPGGNGVYAYSGGSTFPNQTFQGTNYYVDVVFAIKLKLAVSAQTPAPGATNVSPVAPVTVTLDKPVVASTINFTLAAGGTSVPAVLSYNSSTNTASLQ